MSYSKINNIFGWVCFFIATLTYTLTLEPSVSFWDCGEFIASALRLQVVHQPGAPLFLMIQRLFSIFAFGDPTKVAYFMNLGSAVASGATILFLFWTITALAKKVFMRDGAELKTSQLITIMGSGLVGALAYTFSDSFWFSAVESEVYAQSSLFTAIVFWGILKWDAVADDPKSDRWLLFIAYIMGLSIGIHLLNLLTIPAIAFIYYFRKEKNPTTKGIIYTFLIGCFILGLIQYGIIQYIVYFGAYFDLFFVNTLGLGFGTGVLFFALLVIGGITYGIRYSIKHQKRVLNLALLSTTLIIFGYMSFAMIVIRAKADVNLNNNDPDNAFSLLSYLNREQYGDRPLLFGQNYNSERIDYKEGANMYRKGEDKYEVAGRKSDYQYDNTVLFPRMYSQDGDHVSFYKDWMGFDDSHKPSTIDNIKFFATYQVGFMYMRYFMWNFVGRQNEQQSRGAIYEGRALSGIKALDAITLGDQTNLPPSIKESKAYNRFFALPLILGLIGALWHFKRNPKDAGVVGLLFFFTGLAIVLYLNQKPLEPRERDYAYVGSFYAFCIWVGLGVFALREWLFKKLNPQTGAIAATVIGLLAAPIIMAQQGWDDHNRSDKWVARDIAINYLESCAPNAILFTYGDNDTYPLWYAQEVENIRPDIRVVNLSLFDTDWYINSMLTKRNESEALPLSMKPSQYVLGVRDVMPFYDYKLEGRLELKQVVDLLLSDNDADKLPMQDNTRSNFLPTKNFKMSINKEDVLKNNVVPAQWADKIATEMEWNFNKNYITKGNLAMFDILVHNNWKRPIYFASTVPSSQYNGLDNYLYNEGLALRLMPLQVQTLAEDQEPEERVNIYALEKNVMDKFKWGNIKHAKYLDLQSSDDTFIFNNIFSQLMSGLLKEGKIEEAKKAYARYEEVLPDGFFGLRSVYGKYYLAQSLYLMGETAKANKMLEASSDYVRKELRYLADVSDSKHNLTGMQNIRTGLYFLNLMTELSKAMKQEATHKKLEQDFQYLEQRFTPYFATAQ